MAADAPSTCAYCISTHGVVSQRRRVQSTDGVRYAVCDTCDERDRQEEAHIGGAPCPADSDSRWECPIARRLYRQALAAGHQQETAPLFAEPGAARAAWDAFNRHMLEGHDDEEDTMSRSGETPRLPDAYWRDGRLICVPCSDIEDRERPANPRRGDRCSICGEEIEYPITHPRA